ncbi:L,D-transpeptidase family protein [Pseudomonadota bacterium]
MPKDMPENMPASTRVRYLLIFISFYPALCVATTYYLPSPGEHIVGEVQVITAQENDTLRQIARDYEIGYNALIAANPGITQKPLTKGKKITIPSQYILPNTPYEGVVINLPEMRLYYYPPPQAGHKPVVSTYAIGIGKQGYSMPPGISKITSKTLNPTWTVPKSILSEHTKNGVTHPKTIAPGPNNPLGKHALRLGRTSYLIHGTNKPYSIGMRVSHGCIRMYPEDIEMLFPVIPSGTVVRVIHQPLKSGWHGNALYVEAHSALQDPKKPRDTPDDTMSSFIATPDLEIDDVTRTAIRQASESNLGLPVRVYTPDPAARARY